MKLFAGRLVPTGAMERNHDELCSMERYKFPDFWPKFEIDIPRQAPAIHFEQFLQALRGRLPTITNDLRQVRALTPIMQNMRASRRGEITDVALAAIKTTAQFVPRAGN